MPQDRSGNRKAGGVARTRATLMRIALAAALAGLLAGANPSVARAADDGSADDTFLGKFMQKLGLKAPPDRTADINYTERPPLVVPPTRDLPPPAPGLPVAADWPNDSAMKTHKHVRSKVAAGAAACADYDCDRRSGRRLNASRTEWPARAGRRDDRDRACAKSAPAANRLVESQDLVQPGRIRHLYRRADARGSDRSAGRLPYAIPGSALRCRA